MNFTKTAPTWDAVGVEPSTSIQTNGFVAGYKPPAAYFNYLFNNYTACIDEIQTLLGDLDSVSAEEILELQNAVVGFNGSKNIVDYESIKEDAMCGHYCTINGSGFVVFNNNTTAAKEAYTVKHLLEAGTYTVSVRGATTSDNPTVKLGRGDTIANIGQMVNGVYTYTFTANGLTTYSVGIMVAARTTNTVSIQIERDDTATEFAIHKKTPADVVRKIVVNKNKTAVGAMALKGTNIADANTGVGYQAGYSVGTGGHNTAVGHRALVATGTGAANTAIGSSTLTGNTTGGANTALGAYTLQANSTGGNNTALGAYAGLHGNYTNTTLLGYTTAATGNNQVQLGNDDANVYAYAPVQTRCDERDKADVANSDLGLAFIKALTPRKFRYDYRDAYITYSESTDADGNPIIIETVGTKDGSKKRSRWHYGLTAQELKTAMDSLGVDFGGYEDHTINGGADVKTVAYTELIAPLIKAVQEIDEKAETKPTIEKATGSATLTTLKGKAKVCDLVHNLLENTATTTTINGLTFTKNNDGSLKVTGTSTDNIFFNIGNASVEKNKTYMLSGCATGGAWGTYALYIDSNGIANDYGNGAEYIPTETGSTNIGIYVWSGQVMNHTFYPMLEIGTVSHSYVPYSGYDVNVFGANLLDDTPSEAYTVQNWLPAGKYYMKRFNNGSNSQITTKMEVMIDGKYQAIDANGNMKSWFDNGNIICDGISMGWANNPCQTIEFKKPYYFRVMVYGNYKITISTTNYLEAYEKMKKQTIRITNDTDVAYIDTYDGVTNIISPTEVTTLYGGNTQGNEILKDGAHSKDTSNPHGVTKAQVGLGNVDNTSDVDKPVSTAQQAALNTLSNSIVALESLPTSKETMMVDYRFTGDGGYTWDLLLDLSRPRELEIMAVQGDSNYTVHRVLLHYHNGDIIGQVIDTLTNGSYIMLSETAYVYMGTTDGLYKLRLSLTQSTNAGTAIVDVRIRVI